MNKSKFLKRSLAALLSILMVATMIPSAFAAVVTAEDVPTARAADPGFSIWVDNNEATWDSANDAYTAKAEFVEGDPIAPFKVSMKQDKPNTTVKVVKSGTALSATDISLATTDADSKSLTNSFGAGAYTYNMVAETTNSDGEVIDTFNFKLVVNVTMIAPSNDATIKAVKTAKLPYAIKATVDNNNNVIEIMMALGKQNYHDGADSSTYYPVNKAGSASMTEAQLKEVFVPSSDKIASMVYSNGGTDEDATGKLTVTSENGDIKTYTVKYTSEDAFSTFQIGDYTGTVKKDDPTTIYIDLPYDDFTDPEHTNDLATTAPGKDIVLTKLADVAATWTVPSNVVKVTDSNDDTIKSGEFVPAYDYDPSIAAATVETDPDTQVDYFVIPLKSPKEVKVQTKKSGATVAMTIKLRIPTENPNADLDGVQVGDGNQCFDITGETTKIYLPTGSKKLQADGTFQGYAVTVWGSYGATVELAKAGDGDGQQFGATGVETIETPDTIDEASFSATSGAKLLDVTSRLILKVTSQDEKTVKFYNIDVDDTRPTNPVLTSVQLVDDEGKVVADGTIKAGDVGTGTVELTVPFATGIDLDELAALNVVAKADPSTKIEVSNNVYTGTAAVTANKAKYKAEFPVPTLNELGITSTTGSDEIQTKAKTIDFCGVQVADYEWKINSASDGNPTPTYTYSLASDAVSSAITAWITEFDKTQKTAKDNGDPYWEAEAGTATDEGSVIFTYSVEGSKDTLGFTEPGGTLVDDTGLDAAPASVALNPLDDPDNPTTLDAFVKAYDLATIAGVASDILDKDGAGTSISTTIPTKDKKDDPAAGNVFLMKVSNGATTNNATLYTVTVNKKAPNTAADISGVSVTKSDVDEMSKLTVTYPASVSGRKITVNPLPYALRAAAEADVSPDPDMKFSKLDTSTGARVVWFDGTNTHIMKVADTNDDGSINASAEFEAWADTTIANSWATAGKEVVLYVYSEKAWHDIVVTSDTGDYDGDRIGDLDTYYTAVKNDTLTDGDPEYPATTTYKMSASYIDAEREAQLISIASTLDKKMSAVKESNTVKITVPNSYAAASEGSAHAFTLNMTVSKLATIHMGSAGDELKSDNGKEEDVSAATKFKVVGNSDDGYKLYYLNGTYKEFDDKMFIVNEAGEDKSKLNVEVTVKDAETSVDIDSITVDGVRAVKDANDPYVWNLTMPANFEQLQNIKIVPTSQMATILVDDDAYDPDKWTDSWYDLGADIEIKVASEKVPGTPIAYTLKINEGTLSSDASISSITAGEYEAKKGTGTVWTVTVPEGTDMSKAPLTVVTNNSDARITSVNGEAYTTGMTVDLSEGKTVSVVVTAADGTAVTYTVESKFGTTPVTKPSDKFTDIPKDDWSTEFIKDIIDAGIMNGTNSEGTLFSPTREITRKEFVVLVARADVMTKDSSITSASAADAVVANAYSGTPKYNDTKGLDKLYLAAIEYCDKKNIVNGVGNDNFAPEGKVTREMAAKIVSEWAGVADTTLTSNTNAIKDWNSIGTWAQYYVNSAYKAGFMNGSGDGSFTPKRNLTRAETAKIVMLAYHHVAK